MRAFRAYNPFSALRHKLMLAGAGAAYTGITPVFTASVTTGVAPLAVFVEGTGTTAINTPHAWRDCMFAFDSGDTSSGNYTYGTRAGQSKRKNVGGPTWGHVYETPGTYTMYGWVYDGIGYVQRPIATIVVQDPDVVFSGTNTICCSTSGNFTGAPSGSNNQTVANLGAALAFLASGKRVLLQSADTWTTATTYFLRGTKDNMVLGAFGGGRALITITIANSVIDLDSSTLSRLQVRDIEVNGSSIASKFIIGSTGRDITGIHIHNCYGHDIGGFYTTSGSNLARNLSITNCVIERVKGGGGTCGIFVCATNFLMIDSIVDDATASEHCIRFQYVGKGYINGVTSTKPAPSKHCLTIRNPLWAGGSTINVPPNTYSEYLVVSDSSFSSNTDYICTISGADATKDSRTRRVIFERNYVYALGTAAQIGFAISGFENISRNNVYNMTNSGSYATAINTIGNTTYISDGNESWNDVMFSSGTHARECALFGVTPNKSTNNKVKNGVQYTPLSNSAAPVTTTALVATTVTNTTSNAQAKTLNPLFTGPTTSMAGFTLGPGSPYATNAALERNYSDALDKIRVSNGGAHMLASNATSAWTLVGSTP